MSVFMNLHLLTFACSARAISQLENNVDPPSGRREKKEGQKGVCFILTRGQQARIKKKEKEIFKNSIEREISGI